MSSKLSDVELQKQLSEKDLMILNNEMASKRKSAGVAYVLWFFFGGLGIHKIYLGKTLRGLSYLISTILGYGLVFGGLATAVLLGGLLLAHVGISLLVDLFTIPRQIRKSEERTKRELLRQLSHL